MQFKVFKKNSQGLVPVIVQEKQTNQVLMLAYMNEEAYEKTLTSGRMTYYSRSRQSLWIKGETSGHYQYLQSLSYDCDKDTLLACIIQKGVACHEGNKSCFSYPILFESSNINPDLKENSQEKGLPSLKEIDKSTDILEVIYQTIEQRRSHPKDGSYTNYLLEKGIDKILKKVGEETAEIIIGAKNPGKQELIYETADLMYHLSVLLSEKEATWQEIRQELIRRHIPSTEDSTNA